VKLRGHHLVCLHFYRGAGYSEGFVRHLSELLARAEWGEAVEVVAGPDDVCAACPYLEGERCRHTAASEAEVRQMDAAALELLSLAPTEAVFWDSLRARLPEVMPVWRERFCGPCEWRAVCEEAGLAAPQPA